MTKRYKTIRAWEESKAILNNMRLEMERDIAKKSGRNLKLSFPRFMHIISSPEYRGDYIHIDLDKVIKARKRRLL